MDKPLCIPKADLEHHAKVLGASSASSLVSPVDLVWFCVKPMSYLDQFPEDSAHRAEIDAFKASLAAS
jgi:hypothetical protein